ncbi:MAG: sodium/solute symporter [Firmicutes bacterium]|nr:sodium/solute symporter [Bacillota bacterium]
MKPEFGGPTAIITFIVYTAGVLGLGYYASRRIKSSADFWIGGRSLGPWLTAMTLYATTLSGAGYFGAPSAGFTQGNAIAWLNLGAFAGMFIFNTVVGPKLWQVGKIHGLVTVEDYLNKRYGDDVIPTLAAVGGSVFMMLSLYAQFKATGIVMSTILGLDYLAALFVSLGVFTIYTAFGGVLAVVYTDFLQGVIMLFGTVFLIVVPILKAGGLTAMNTKLATIAPKLVTWHGAFTAGFALSWIIHFVFSFNSSPYQVQRGFMAKGFRTFRTMLPIILVSFFLTSTMKYSGMAAQVMIKEGTMAKPPNADWLFPYLVYAIFPSGVAIFFLIACMAAIMSTGDSLLMYVSTALTRNVYQKFMNPKAPESRLMKVSQWTVVALSTILFLLAVLERIAGLQIPIIYMLVQVGTGGLTTLFAPGLLYGLFWKRTTRSGVLAGMLAGSAALVAAFVCRNGYAGKAVQEAYYSSIWSLGGFHEAALGATVALVVTPVISLLTRAPESDLVEKWFPGKGVRAGKTA